jgi:hypothetical protein
MEDGKPMFRLETRSGEPIVAEDSEIVPQSQTLTIRWPNGGYVWNRSVAVVVKRGDQEERLPILDVTLVARWARSLLWYFWSFRSERSSIPKKL